jgi:thermitase
VRFSKTFVAIGLILGVFGVHSSAQAPARGPYVAGEILVKFTPGANANARAGAHTAAGGTLLAEVARTRVHRVRVRAGDESAAIQRYLRNPNVLYAEPNFIRRLPTPIAHGEGALIPGDYYFHEQWALDNTGQAFQCIPWPFGGELCLNAGTPDADIDAPEAWEILKGNSNVTVAVIDSGVDYTNPDLAPNYAGGDDFVFGDGDPMDDHGHGTHVAGTIAAAMENPTGNPAESEGVVGVAPNARILAYKVCRADGSCDDFAIQQAIARAVTDGADIINMSLGESEYSQSLDDAVQDAWNAGLVIVAGAGNDGTTVPFYPAALNNVISVAAFDEDHRRPSFSNYGSWVDISAPGNVILSTYPMTKCASTTTPGDTGCYAWNTGTSMAAPHVAGAAALVWSRSDVTSNSQVVDILLESADPVGVANVRLDSWTIHGGLNVHDAVSRGLTNLPPHAHAGPNQTVLDNNGDGTELVTLDGTTSFDSDGSIVGYEWREGGTAIGVGATSAVWLSGGVHTLTLEVTDDDGDSATDTVVVTVDPPPTVGSFTLSVTPGNMTVMRGLGGTSTITITAQDGFTGNVTLSATGLPSGVTASFSPNPATGTSQLTLNASSTATTGAASVTLTGVSGTVTSSTTLSLTVSVAPNSTFPGIWFDQDIGSVGVAGSASYLDGVVTVRASGQQIWNTADGLHYLYQSLTGDGTIVARVNTLTGGTSSQSAGVMIRETLDANSRHAYAAFSQSQIYFTNRTTTGGSTSAQTLTGKTLPHWVRLTRSGNTFTAAASADGVSWVQIGTPRTITMMATVYVGLAVSSGQNSTLATGTFNNVSLSTSAAPAPILNNVSPASGATGTQVVLSGVGFGASQGNSVVRLNGAPVAVNAWSNTSITITIPSGATSGPLAVSVAPSMNNSNPLTFTVVTLPAPWLNQDIGSVGVAGSVSYASGVFTVRASGQWIWNAADGLHYVYQSLTGDGTIVARVNALTGGASSQSAGVMIRETLDANSKHAYAAFSQSQIYFTNRTTTGGSTAAQTLTGKTLPYWVKLTRSGSTFTAAASADGVTWVQVGTPRTINMTAAAYVGLAVSSGQNSALATATFDNVSLTPGAPPTAGFTLSTSPSSMNLTQGSSGTSTITIAPQGGFAGNVTLSATGLPSGVTASFSPNPATSNSQLTLTANSTATTGTVSVTLTGTSGAMTSSTTLALTVAANSTLPSGWLNQDIGSVGVAGSASYAGGVFTVRGAGQQIWNTADGLHLAYQPLAGDGTIVARVGSLTGGGSSQSAGVMIRETLTANSKHAYVAFSQSQIYFTNRTTTGGTTSAQSLTGKTLPYWVKLTRSGSTFTAAASPDGVNWVQVGAPRTINMTTAVYVGLAVSSGQNSTLATAAFDNVSISE